MKKIWDAYYRDEVGLNDVVSAYQAKPEIGELVGLLDGQDSRANALYVLSELRGELVSPFWRQVSPHVSDPDEQIAFYALDVFHSFANASSPREALFVLRSVDLNSPFLFAKLFSIVLTFSEVFVERVCTFGGKEPLSPTEKEGLALLAKGSCVAVTKVRMLLQQPDLVLCFYGCCIAGRHYPGHKSLMEMLPPKVRKRLTIYQNSRRNR